MKSVDVLQSRLWIWRHDISPTLEDLPEAGFVLSPLGQPEGETCDRYGLHVDRFFFLGCLDLHDHGELTGLVNDLCEGTAYSAIRVCGRIENETTQ